MPIKIHSQFKLNGASFSNTGLLEMGRSLAKEGKPFEQGIGDFLLAWSSDKPTITVQTSGATGTPKPIVLRKEFMV
ncbi:MAG: O-succinylbenzoic acid--CoA ligase, partial [Flavobacteriaceae bacterium]